MSQISLQSIRGMNDILPLESKNWHFLETLMKNIAQSYGYQEIRTPIIEPVALFKRTIGDETDIVTKEMYAFADRNGDELVLRPEGTASCVRAAIQHGLLHNQQQRLWYLGPMYRHERPQKGRYRQFYQFGIEAFGFSSRHIELELLLLAHRLWHSLAIDKKIKLQINTLGSQQERQIYKEKLVSYLSRFESSLDEDSQKRLKTNPLRILDSKVEKTQEVLTDAPKLNDSLSLESQKHFDALLESLSEFNIAYEVNPKLVRGLDYYNGCVFEWTTDELGAQGTICAGGRYDGLVEQLGGQSVPAAGFAVGLERLLLMLEQRENSAVDFYCIASSEAAQNCSYKLAENLRNQFPHLTIIQATELTSFKSQFKKADKSQAKVALVIGEDELANQQVTLKYLREDKPQHTIAQSQLTDWAQQEFK